MDQYARFPVDLKLPSPSLEHKMTQLMASLERLNPATAALLAVGLLVAAISIWAATGLYQIHPGEAAITLRFGQLCDRIVGP